MQMLHNCAQRLHCILVQPLALCVRCVVNKTFDGCCCLRRRSATRASQFEHPASDSPSLRERSAAAAQQNLDSLDARARVSPRSVLYLLVDDDDDDDSW